MTDKLIKMKLECLACKSFIKSIAVKESKFDIFTLTEKRCDNCNSVGLIWIELSIIDDFNTEKKVEVVESSLVNP